MTPVPPKLRVNVNRMILYSFIPILSIYAGWRIEKFWVLFGINFGLSIVISIPLHLLMIDFPYDSIILYVIVIPITILVVRHFARKYNETISSSESHLV